MPTLHEVQETMRKLVEQDYRNAEVYARHLLNEAAPALLEALEMIITDFKASGFANPEELAWWNTACAAIAKAKGESKPLVTSEGKSE